MKKTPREARKIKGGWEREEKNKEDFISFLRHFTLYPLVRPGSGITSALEEVRSTY
jgi:hypothetical protein